MAYTKQTWTDNVSVANATRLNYIEEGISDSHVRGQGLMVAAFEAPDSVKDAADYVCDGTDDQVQINAALLRATRPGDGFGGEGHGRVNLVGPTFQTSQNGSTTITMYPSTSLFGSSYGTLIRPMWATNVDRGAIELLNGSTDHVRVSTLTIGRPTATRFNGHGIKFVGNGTGNSNEIKTGNDPFNQVDNVYVLQAQRVGMLATGTTGGSRETVVRDCVFWNCWDECLWIDSSSDTQVIGCRANGGGGGKAGFRLGGGNTMVVGCKAYFSESPADGFLIESSRCMISHCTAQDNGQHGFNFTGNDVVASNLIADSNSRLLSTGVGFNIAARGVYEGLEAFDRGQTASSPQLVQFNFVGNPQAFVTGRSWLGNNGTVHVAGSLGTNSYARIVRHGTTVYSVG